MTYILPPQATRQHLQDNKSETSGTIYQSRNINLDEDGYIKLSDASFASYTTDDDADFDTADAMFPSDNSIFVNSGELFAGDADFDGLSSRAGDTDAPSPGVEEDVVYFNGTEVVSDGANIYYRSDTTEWTAVSVSGSGFNTLSPTSLCTWDSADVLVVGNNNIVKFIDNSWVVSGTVLTLPNQYRVSSLHAIGDTLYIATRNDSGAEAKVFTTSTIQASADYSYPAGAFEVTSIQGFKSTIVGLNSLGQLIRFNGGGFDVLGTLPIYATTIEWADALNDYSTSSNRALVVDGDLIYINLSSLTSDSHYKLLPNFPSGIWCYDDTSGSLYHKYSPSYSRIKTISGSGVTVDATDNDFTLTSGNLDDCVAGMPVIYDSAGGAIPELEDMSLAYYLIKDSSTVFRLAESYADAIAGTAIDITGTGHTGNSYYVIKTNDYGWTAYDNRMATAVLNSKLARDGVGRICFTAELFAKQDTSTDKTVFCPVSPLLPNRGYVVTPKLFSPNIEEIYNNIFIKFKPLGADDKIIVKYKTVDRKDFPFSSRRFGVTSKWTGTWTDTDTFTTTCDMSDVEVGDEIELVAGVGSGHIAHISSLSVNAGTWTVNLDDAFPFAVANDVFMFNVDNWTKLETISSTSKTAGQGYYELPTINAENTGTFLQIKVELRGIGTTVSEVLVRHTPFIVV